MRYASLPGMNCRSRFPLICAFGNPAIRDQLWPVALRPRLATCSPLSGRGTRSKLCIKVISICAWTQLRAPWHFLWFIACMHHYRQPLKKLAERILRFFLHFLTWFFMICRVLHDSVIKKIYTFHFSHRSIMFITIRQTAHLLLRTVLGPPKKTPYTSQRQYQRASFFYDDQYWSCIS